MSSNSYKTRDGLFFVDIEKPTKELTDKYYLDTGEIRSSTPTASTPKEFQKATISHTFDEDKYPTGSVWMMGETPGMKINFFGESFIAIQEKDLYARID